MPDSVSKPKTVAVLGAGPVGLAAAVHVLERGMEPVVLEAGPEAAHAVRQWGHVRMFSPWEYNIDKAAERLLAAWSESRFLFRRVAPRGATLAPPEAWPAVEALGRGEEDALVLPAAGA